jgi:hypothetical protein
MGDRARQVIVTVGAVFALFGLLLGSGLLGVPVQEGFGGAFAADATLLTPAGPAFSIWSVVYLGLFGFAIWHWLDGNAARPRIAAMAIPATLSLILNGTWLLVVQFGGTSVGAMWLSVAVVIALETSLAVLIQRLSADRARDRAELVLVDGTFGLYFGWTSVAVVANIAAAGLASGLHPRPSSAEWVAVAVVVAVAMLGVLFARRLGGRIAVGAAMSWGLGWIAVGRLAATPPSVVVGIGALASAVLVLGAAVVASIRAMIDRRGDQSLAVQR